MQPEMTMTQHLLAAMLARPWFVAPTALPSIVGRLQQRAAAAARMDLAAIEAAVVAYQEAPLGRIDGSVAVIPVSGVITKKPADAWWYGGTSVDRMCHAFRTYLADPSVSAIVHYMDTPGGEVYGVPEYAEEVFAARGKKALIAVCDPVMASAGYWVGAACEEIYMLPSGQVGSVGCYTMHENLEKYLERIGIAITFIQHGDNKTEGNPFEALSDAARADLQKSVDFYGGLFDKAVAKGRAKTVDLVLETFGQGRMFHAPEAKRIGMVDKVGGLDVVLARFNGKRGRLAVAGALIEVVTAGGAPGAGGASSGPVADKQQTVDPLDDGSCPGGYEKGEDGMCHLEAKAEGAPSPVAEGPSDADRTAVALAVLS